MADIILDLHGSIQQQGITSLRHDYAVRNALVTNLDNSAAGTDLGVAILRSFNEVGLFHQSLHAMPLTKIRAVKWGKDKARVQLIYQRGRFGQPPITALNTASTYRSHEFIPVYRLPFVITSLGMPRYADGIPDGDWHKLAEPTDKTTPPIAYRFKRPVVRLVYNTVLPFNPFADTEQHLNKVNQSTVQFGLVMFPAGTLRFDGVNAESSQFNAGSGIGGAESTPIYDVQYEFTGNPQGHFQQYVYWDAIASIWKTENVLGHEESPFDPGDFPAH